MIGIEWGYVPTVVLVFGIAFAIWAEVDARKRKRESDHVDHGADE